MSSKGGKFVHCVGAPEFDPKAYAEDRERHEKANQLLAQNNLYSAVNLSFGIDPRRDTYVYHAMTSVRLPQVQEIVNMGGKNGLHAWYRDDEGKPLDPPPQADVEAYVSIFLPTTLTSSALKSFLSNAKKSSLRFEIASHLTAHRYIHPSLATTLAIPKCKKATSCPPNPYVDFWAWSCRNLEWAGPHPSSAKRVQSHHVLPIFMHHFGCATPSHEALSILKTLLAGRAVADMGSGNGYWTFMLRLYGVTAFPVDNMQSEWRVNWVSDTEIADGVKWLKKRDSGRDLALLLVYPVVGGGVAGGEEGGFTRGLVEAYEGDTIAVVGTQNGNGYTGFKGVTMDQYMEREHKEWTKVVQIPLPSFAGKDEALFVFQRGERAPKDVASME
ncbi:hypothetical protein CGCS363_v012383 [Colletotrichum siamense]|uniref:uncharacterized protein n=1 Tax=Colletotrichum siamense TaxID=690259 RepID=UPI0018724706|nr:uncharacterized protein CGCS363_v012383 [Colletotrichum siamense]KAF5488984.1 hypothetical protein CGCS363_v012383 [Colletotrichum siamense]